MNAAATGENGFGDVARGAVFEIERIRHDVDHARTIHDRPRDGHKATGDVQVAGIGDVAVNEANPAAAGLGEGVATEVEATGERPVTARAPDIPSPGAAAAGVRGQGDVLKSVLLVRAVVHNGTGPHGARARNSHRFRPEVLVVDIQRAAGIDDRPAARATERAGAAGHEGAAVDGHHTRVIIGGADGQGAVAILRETGVAADLAGSLEDVVRAAADGDGRRINIRRHVDHVARARVIEGHRVRLEESGCVVVPSCGGLDVPSAVGAAGPDEVRTGAADQQVDLSGSRVVQRQRVARVGGHQRAKGRGPRAGVVEEPVGAGHDERVERGDHEGGSVGLEVSCHDNQVATAARRGGGAEVEVVGRGGGLRKVVGEGQRAGSPCPAGTEDGAGGQRDVAGDHARAFDALAGAADEGIVQRGNIKGRAGGDNHCRAVGNRPVRRQDQLAAVHHGGAGVEVRAFERPGSGVLLLQAGQEIGTSAVVDRSIHGAVGCPAQQEVSDRCVGGERSPQGQRAAIHREAGVTTAGSEGEITVDDVVAGVVVNGVGHAAGVETERAGQGQIAPAAVQMEVALPRAAIVDAHGFGARSQSATVLDGEGAGRNGRCAGKGIVPTQRQPARAGLGDGVAAADDAVDAQRAGGHQVGAGGAHGEIQADQVAASDIRDVAAQRDLAAI